MRILERYSRSVDSKTEITNEYCSTIKRLTHESEFITDTEYVEISKDEEKNTRKESRLYQDNIIDDVCSADDNFGRIISLETGLGKTFIALRIILHKIGIRYSSDNDSISNEQYKSLKMNKTNSLFDQKILFLVPTKNLVEQQSKFFEANFKDIYQDLLVIPIRNASDYRKNCDMYNQKDRPIVFVMVNVVALILLRTGFMNIEELAMIVFDECHHTRDEHPYNLLMKEFYFYGIDFELDEEIRYNNRPFILGLTASPIKTKIKDSSLLHFKFEMIEEMKELCNNMNSKIVSADIKHIDDRLISKHKNYFITYKMRDYWSKIHFIKDPWSIVPNIIGIIKKYEKFYSEDDLTAIYEGLD